MKVIVCLWGIFLILCSRLKETKIGAECTGLHPKSLFSGWLHPLLIPSDSKQGANCSQSLPQCVGRETLPSTWGQEKEGGEKEASKEGGSVVWLLLLVSKQSFPTLTRATNLRGEGKKEGNNSSLSHLPSTALHFDCFSQCFPLPFSFAPLVQIPVS